jgi:hypothetical protein
VERALSRQIKAEFPPVMGRWLAATSASGRERESSRRHRPVPREEEEESAISVHKASRGDFENLHLRSIVERIECM